MQNKVACTGHVPPLERSLHVVIALNYVMKGTAKQTPCYLSCSLSSDQGGFIVHGLTCQKMEQESLLPLSTVLARRLGTIRTKFSVGNYQCIQCITIVLWRPRHS
jgi:hypothetical protein